MKRTSINVVVDLVKHPYHNAKDDCSVSVQMHVYLTVCTSFNLRAIKVTKLLSYSLNYFKQVVEYEKTKYVFDVISGIFVEKPCFQSKSESIIRSFSY